MRPGLSNVASLQKLPAFLFRVTKMPKEDIDIGKLKIVPGEFLLRLKIYVTIVERSVVITSIKRHIKYAIYALTIHGQAFKAICKFAGYWPAVKSSYLLEIGELRYLHTIAPDFPAKAPRTERRTLPIIFNKPYVVMF
jgi:hypothetical protein